MAPPGHVEGAASIGRAGRRVLKPKLTAIRGDGVMVAAGLFPDN